MLDLRLAKNSVVETFWEILGVHTCIGLSFLHAHKLMQGLWEHSPFVVVCRILIGSWLQPSIFIAAWTHRPVNPRVSIPPRYLTVYAPGTLIDVGFIFTLFPLLGSPLPFCVFWCLAYVMCERNHLFTSWCVCSTISLTGCICAVRSWMHQ
jgi:hypothetical protein